MAMKDWKKWDGREQWDSLKNNDSIEIIEDLTGNRGKELVGYEVDIYIFETQKSNSKHIVKKFKTKPKAIAYAKSYMRTH